MKACRACAAPLIWARTENGNAIPIDADPHEKGNFMLIARDPDPPLARFAPPAQREKFERDGVLVVLYRSHFGTCPEAKRFRHGPKPRPREAP